MPLEFCCTCERDTPTDCLAGGPLKRPRASVRRLTCSGCAFCRQGSSVCAASLQCCLRSPLHCPCTGGCRTGSSKQQQSGAVDGLRPIAGVGTMWQNVILHARFQCDRSPCLNPHTCRGCRPWWTGCSKTFPKRRSSPCKVGRQARRTVAGQLLPVEGALLPCKRLQQLFLKRVD